MTATHLRRVEVDGRLVDVVVDAGRVTQVGPDLTGPAGCEEVDGAGGALLPGLHDHHLHLLATAAARASVTAGPPEVADRAGLARALAGADRALPSGRWIRAVGYHESVAGDLDRHELDALVPNRPVRLQHRGGARWVLNSAGIAALHLGARDHQCIERGADAEPTGRIHRGDEWLRTLLPAEAPDLAPVGRELARAGVTGVTDATPFSSVGQLDAIGAAVSSGALPQRVVVTGAASLAAGVAPPGLTWGPVKVIIDDAVYPPLDEVVAQVTAAHTARRPVAIHCVTRAALALAIAAWDAAGSMAGDRVEHGAVVPPELCIELAERRLTVVTQPAFVVDRGDQYLDDVDPADLPYLYPCRSLLEAGVLVAGSSDAPYAPPDPWLAIDAAVRRRTRAGAPLGPGEAISPERALDLFLGDPASPGGPVRRVEPGTAGDLCLLDAPLADALAQPSAERVAATWRAGDRIA